VYVGTEPEHFAMALQLDLLQGLSDSLARSLEDAEKPRRQAAGKDMRLGPYCRRGGVPGADQNAPSQRIGAVWHLEMRRYLTDNPSFGLVDYLNRHSRQRLHFKSAGHGSVRKEQSTQKRLYLRQINVTQVCRPAALQDEVTLRELTCGGDRTSAHRVGCSPTEAVPVAHPKPIVRL
jgi:hypothetical protein